MYFSSVVFTRWEIIVRGQSYGWRLPKYWPHALPPHRPPLVRGEDTLARRRGGGGQYFGRRQTQLCTLRMQVLCVFTPSHPATSAAFKSYLSSLHVYSLTNTVSPLRACLSIWWERFRDSQKEYDRGPLSIQSSLLLTNKLNPIASKKRQTLFNIYFTQWPRNNKT